MCRREREKRGERMKKNNCLSALECNSYSSVKYRKVLTKHRICGYYNMYKTIAREDKT